MTTVETAAPAEKLYTVEEASKWLTCPQPVPLPLLQKLGKDCSLVARVWNVPTGVKLTPTKPWPQEKTYPASIIREVFGSNPDTRHCLPPLPETSMVNPGSAQS